MKPIGAADARPADDLATLVAISVLAACITTFAHEAMGHGGACLLSGGQITRLTSVYFHCAPQTTWITAAGPLGNLAMALIAWLVRAAVPPSRIGWRLLLALVTAFSLFWEAGYVVYAMLNKDGDWWFAARSLFGEPHTPWRIGGAVLGLALYAIGVVATARAIRPFANAPGRARRILQLAWLSGTVAAVVAAVAYSPDRQAIRQAALEIGAGSIPLLIMRVRSHADDGAPAMPRGWAWVAAAALIYAGFVMTLGRGVPP